MVLQGKMKKALKKRPFHGLIFTRLILKTIYI
jgi:hypothetical protein